MAIDINLTEIKQNYAQQKYDHNYLIINLKQ